MTDANERRSAGRATGLLWLLGGISGALFYLVPGADLAHWRLGLVSCTFSVVLGIACLLAPWRRMRSEWFYAAAGRLRRAQGEGKDRWDAGSDEVGVHVQAT